MRDNSVPTRGRREPIYSLGEIQKAVEKVPYAWNRFKNPDGYSISCLK